MKSRMPPLYALRAFDIAAQVGSFTRAAEEMHLTQSAISRHIKNLEQTLGYELFIRNGPNIKLTERGQMFAKALGKGFKQIEKACELMQPNHHCLKIKTPTSLTSRCLLSPIQAYKKRHKTINLLLSSVLMDRDKVDFATEDYDCAVLLCNGEFGEDIKSLKLFDEELVPIFSPNYNQQMPSINMNQLLSDQFIHPSHDRRDWIRWLKHYHYPLANASQGGLIFDSLEKGISAAMQGHGVSIADLNMVKKEIVAGNLMSLPQAALLTGDAYYLVWSESNIKQDLINDFGDFLRQSMLKDSL